MKTLLTMAFIAIFGGLALRAETAYFVVSYPPCYGPYTGPESTNAFVLPLTQAHDIENARLRSATGGCFGSDDVRPVFTIHLGADGTNRNVALPSQPFWSWHVAQFTLWSGVRGSYQHPFQLERDVLNGLKNDGDTVAFSEIYTVTAEINPPLKLFFFNYELGDFVLHWTHDAPNTAYSLEWTDSLTTLQWKALDQLPPPGPNAVPFTQIGPKAYEIPANPAYNYFFRLRLEPKP